MNAHLQQLEPIVLRGVADLLWPPGSTQVHLTDEERVLSAHRLVITGEAEACRYYAIALGIASEANLQGVLSCREGLPRFGARP